MNTFVTEQNGELAQIFMKDGSTMMAILLNDIEAPESFENEVRCVRTSNVSEWLETSDEELVEVLDPDHIDGIDLYLK